MINRERQEQHDKINKGLFCQTINTKTEVMKTEKEQDETIRLSCLELACSVLKEQENIVYDKATESDQNVENAHEKNMPIYLNVKGRGIQNSCMSYRNVNIENMLLTAQKFYDFVTDKTI